jgi:D-sedoheptulose 7-phosphate isomerase
LITCFSNDYGFENWLAKAIEYYAEKGDMLISISSSGESKNILKASKYFKSYLGQVVTFTGHKENNKLKKIGNINFWVNSSSYNMVENIHQFWLLMCVDLIIGKKDYKSNL